MKKRLLLTIFLLCGISSSTLFFCVYGNAFTDFFTETIPSAASSAGNWIKGAAESTGDWFKGAANFTYEKAILPTYEKALIPFYEGALKPTYEVVLKPALNWVGNEVIIPTLIKVVIPAFKWASGAYNYLNDKGLHYVTDGIQDGLNYVLEKTHANVAIDQINKAAEWTGDKLSSTVLYPLVEPLRQLKSAIEKQIPVLQDSSTYIMGSPLYTTDISGKKVPAVDAHGAPVMDPANPALTDRVFNAITPVYNLVDKLGGMDNPDGTHAAGFIEVVGNLIVTIHETRKQIQQLQQDLGQSVANMSDADKKTFQAALTELDNDLKNLANTVSLAEKEKQGYQLIRAADADRKEESIFCPPQGGGAVCDIATKGIAAKASFDTDLTNLNKLLQQLGNDVNAGSSTCGLCKLADISDKDCTYPMRLQMSADILQQIVSNVLNKAIQSIVTLSVTEAIKLLESTGLIGILPPGIRQGVEYGASDEENSNEKF